MESASKGIEIIQNKECEDIFMKAWCLTGQAINYSGLEDIDKALKAIKNALKIFKSLDYAWGMSTCYFILSKANQKLGNISEAEKNTLEGLEISNTEDLKNINNPLKLRLISLRIEQKRIDDAIFMLGKIPRRSLQSVSYKASFYYYKSCIENLNGKKIASHKSMIKALDLCENSSLYFWGIGLNTIQFKILAEIYTSGKKQEYINDLLIKASPENRAKFLRSVHKKDETTFNKIEKFLNILSSNPDNFMCADLFGKFSISINERKIDDKAWNSKKALMICKYLLANRKKGFIKKEILMELLWPEDDPAKTSKRFHVALAALRKILEPDIKKGVPSSFIKSSGDSYCLSIGDNGQIDIEIFQNESEKGKIESDIAKKISHLEKSVLLYKGEFLQEDVFIDWCMDEREKFKQNYLSILSEIISCYEEKKDYPKCIEFSNKYLAEDKYSENIYRKLMTYYFHTGNRAMLINTFKLCQTRISNEFDSPVTDETLKLFNQLQT